MYRLFMSTFARGHTCTSVRSYHPRDSSRSYYPRGSFRSYYPRGIDID